MMTISMDEKSQFNLNLTELSQKYLPPLRANYMYFAFENRDTKKRIIFNTHPKWYQSYVGASLIDHCPLYAAVHHLCDKSERGSAHFLWKHAIAQNKKQREVVGLRAEHGIANGLTFSRLTKNFQITLGLATDPKDHEFEAKYQFLLPTIITLYTEASFICMNQFQTLL